MELKHIYDSVFVCAYRQCVLLVSVVTYTVCALGYLSCILLYRLSTFLNMCLRVCAFVCVSLCAWS